MLDRLDARTRSRVQLLLGDRFSKARLHYVAQHFLAYLLTELLTHYFDRHFAGTEALQTHGATHRFSRSSTAFSTRSAGT